MSAHGAAPELNEVPVMVCMDMVPQPVLPLSPSITDGLSANTETALRVWGCHLIQDTGILLEQPQVS